MARYSVIKEGKVVNVVEWDGVAPWHPGEGYTLVRSDICDKDDIYDEKDATFTKKNGVKIHKDKSINEYQRGE